MNLDSLDTFDLLIDGDTRILLSSLTDNDGGGYINDATPVEMSLFKLAVRKRVWILTPNVVATGGTWTLTFRGKTTAAIDYDATLWEIQAALEALTVIMEGDIIVSGQLISAGTDGLVIEFAETWSDVDAVTFDFSSITGPTDAASTCVKKTNNLFKGAVTDEGGGKVGIPVIRHSASSGDFIRIEGSQEELDGEYTVDAATTADKIVVTAVFADVSQTMTGVETLLIGMVNATEISLTYDGEGTGGYDGILPYTIEGLVQNQKVNTSYGQVELGRYLLFGKAVKAGNQRTWVILGKATF